MLISTSMVNIISIWTKYAGARAYVRSGSQAAGRASAKNFSNSSGKPVALWWQWREQAEEGAEENDASEHRAGRGRQPPSSQ